MRPAALSVFAICLLVLSAACSEKLVLRTQLMAVVSADDDIRPQIQRLRIRVSGRAADDDDWRAPRLDQEYTQLEWPFRVGIVPDAGDARRRVLIEITAVSRAGEELMALRAITGYLPGRTLALPLVFESSCLQRNCGDETCRAGDCVSAEVDPKDLVDLDHYDADRESVTGGRSDAGDRDELEDEHYDTSPDKPSQDPDGQGERLDAAVIGEVRDASTDGHIPSHNLCGKAGELETPGEECPDVVTCGYAGRCDLTQNICCTASIVDLGGDCTKGSSCDLNARTYCDGPEDCLAGSVCCFAGGGTACAKTCSLGSEMCHVTADCSAGVCARGSPGGEAFWNYWGVCR